MLAIKSSLLFASLKWRKKGPGMFERKLIAWLESDGGARLCRLCSLRSVIFLKKIKQTNYEITIRPSGSTLHSLPPHLCIPLLSPLQAGSLRLLSSQASVIRWNLGTKLMEIMLQCGLRRCQDFLFFLFLTGNENVSGAPCWGGNYCSYAWMYIMYFR